jgi:hypothetical protein
VIFPSAYSAKQRRELETLTEKTISEHEKLNKLLKVNFLNPEQYNQRINKLCGAFERGRKSILTAKEKS